MERGNRLVWVAGVAAAPALVLLGMLFFELKRVEIVNADADAELRLGRQKREREAVEAEAEPAPEPVAPS